MSQVKTKESTPISFRLESSVVEALDAYSKTSMIPKTRLVEVAIKEFLDKHKEA